MTQQLEALSEPAKADHYWWLLQWLRGVGSVVDLFPAPRRFTPTAIPNDYQAITSDWQAVAEDLNDAGNKLAMEFKVDEGAEPYVLLRDQINVVVTKRDEFMKQLEKHLQKLSPDQQVVLLGALLEECAVRAKEWSEIQKHGSR